MLEAIADLPDNVIGFRAKGTVTSSDYETVLIPAVEAAFSQQKKVRFLYHLGDDFDSFEAGAMWDDARLGLRHLSGWEKMAVVTDETWIRTALRVFGLAIPGHVRVFHNQQLDDAIHWVSE
ncbi:MAG: STAS/SEC14 domain-containing protein [Alcanivorax sp.]|nr:STAS/SEC14 domain-containing protein [Alcanivorax sp.]